MSDEQPSSETPAAPPAPASPAGPSPAPASPAPGRSALIGALVDLWAADRAIPTYYAAALADLKERLTQALS